eukprot:6010105-Lingulodinium_polyedra.AAC.1
MVVQWLGDGRAMVGRWSDDGSGKSQPLEFFRLSSTKRRNTLSWWLDLSKCSAHAYDGGSADMI